MKVLKERFNLGVLLAQTLGVAFWMTAAYLLFLSVKRDELSLLIDQSVSGFDLPAPYEDLFWGDLYGQTYFWLAKARLAVMAFSLLAVLLVRHKGKRLFINAILLIPIAFAVLGLGISEDLCDLVSGATKSANFIHGFFLAMFTMLGAFFLFLNSKAVSSRVYGILKKPFFGRFMVPWKNPLSAEERKAWTSHSIKSKSGAQIKALYRKAENECGTIVLGHPMGKAAKGTFLKNGHAQRLLDEGFSLWVFDFNGFGESEMGNFDFHEDVEAVAKMAATKGEGLPVGYHGISLGGMSVCPLLSKEINPFQCVILESAATTLPEFWKHYPIAHKVLKTWFFFAPRKAKYIRYIDHMPRLFNVRKLFLIYSDADKYSSLTMGERYQKGAAVPAELWNASGSEHALAFKEHPVEYWEKAIGFFKENLPTQQD